MKGILAGTGLSTRNRGRRARLLAVALVGVWALAAGGELRASSILGGAPGRSDRLKRAGMAGRAATTAGEKPRERIRAGTVAVGAVTPASEGESTPAERARRAPSRSLPTLTYDDVLNEQQKAQLRARAEVLNTHPHDYNRLLAPDERATLESLLRERQRQALTAREQ